MYALLTALVLAQTSISIGAGSKPKLTDSARAERERKQDSSRLRYEIWRDSVIAAHGNRDSTDRLRRRAKQIALTPALLANAFKDPGARVLLTAARKSRLEQDSSITGYDATAYERISVALQSRSAPHASRARRAHRVGTGESGLLRNTWEASSHADARRNGRFRNRHG